ncbi:hypothetical protein AMTR_s00096p00109680 [Amborella trichopoda]|uniref:Uncharacterized protein n=1 Tax=Amborella trichopoda TaxID=13333 RepID=W1P420_AMBTC|nr:hypothetical protein AMTR_s00096p00109680 [Amborella trichopoda]
MLSHPSNSQQKPMMPSHQSEVRNKGQKRAMAITIFMLEGGGRGRGRSMSHNNEKPWHEMSDEDVHFKRRRCCRQ